MLVYKSENGQICRYSADFVPTICMTGVPFKIQIQEFFYTKHLYENLMYFVIASLLVYILNFVNEK